MLTAIFLLLTNPPGLSMMRSKVAGSDEFAVHWTVIGCVGSSDWPSVGDVKVKAVMVVKSIAQHNVEKCMADETRTNV